MSLNIVEGLLSGGNFLTLFLAIKALVENNLNTSLLLKLSGILALIFIIRLTIYSIAYTQGHIGGADVAKRIRLFLGDKLKMIPLSNFTKNKTGWYINVVTSDVNNYEKILTHKLGDIIKNSALISMLIIFILTVNLYVGLIALCAALLLTPALWLSFRAVRKYGSEKNETLADNVSDMVEYITGIQTLRVYGLGGTKNKTVTASMKAYSDISFVYEAKIIPIGVIFSVLAGLSMPATALVIGSGWLNGHLDTTVVLIVVILPIFICKLAGTLFVDLTSYKNLLISKAAIEKAADEKEEAARDAEFSPANCDIRFDKVFFAYEKNEPVLQGVSFTAKNGKLTAIVGDSGAGKSTILNLISKFYEPQAGKIEIDGVNICEVGSEKVLNWISMVDQDVFLFNDTIKNNVRHARPSATDAEVEEACQLANCDEFIEKMERGYDTPIGENGNQLSGGERQRLSVARAILKDSPILLLDEATASLDIQNELAVKEAICSNLLQKRKTVVMIAHTLSIIQNADQILVISGGKVLESGKHAELLANSGKYAAMWCAEKQLYIAK